MDEFLVRRVKSLADEVAQASAWVKSAVDQRDSNQIRQAKDRLQFATGQLATELYLLALENSAARTSG